MGRISRIASVPWRTSKFISQATQNGHNVPLQLLWMLAGAFIAVAIFTQVLQTGATYFAVQLAWSATNTLRTDLAGHALSLDMSYHTATSPGDIIERVDGDVATLARFFSRFVVYVLGNGLLMVGVLGLLYHVDWRVGLGLSAFVALALTAFESVIVSVAL